MRQQFSKLSQAMQDQSGQGPLLLKNVVEEYNFIEQKFFLQDIIKNFFRQRRKFDSNVKQEKPKQLSEIKSVKLYINVSHGSNVPIRQSMRKMLTEFRQGRDQSRTLGMYNPVIPTMSKFGMNNPNNFGGGNQVHSALGPDVRELKLVQSFVNIRLVYHQNGAIIESKAKSKVDYGPNPDWNSEQIVEYEADSSDGIGLSLSEINNSKNLLFVSLFDRKGKEKQVYDNRKRKIIHIDEYYLGTVVIPMTELFQNPQMNATFQINRPIVIFGYYITHTSLFGTDPNEGQHELPFVNPQIPTTISLSITMSPEIEIPQSNDAPFYPGFENLELLEQGVQFLETHQQNSSYGQRFIKLWGDDINQQSIFMCRYLQPLEPPFQVNDLGAIQRAARFVSLIPFKNDTEHFQDVPDIFATSQQFLDLKGGDEEEHAFLLCNYFNFIDQALVNENVKSYVITGKAIPEGTTFYVVRRNIKTNQVEIWNPGTGDPYVLTTKDYTNKLFFLPMNKGRQAIPLKQDMNCPLYEVGSVISENNIFINIQPNAAPGQISWVLEDQQLWMPFINNIRKAKFFNNGPLTTIQTPLIYEPTPREYVQRLAKTIDAFIRDKIKDLRQGKENNLPFISKFNDADSDQVRKQLLNSLESIQFTSRTSGLESDLLKKEDQISQEKKALEQLGTICQRLQESCQRSGQSIYGFPLNFTYTDNEAIWTQIEATGIHDILKNNIEYLCCVECYEYPNFVISVWLFIAVLYDDER